MRKFLSVTSIVGACILVSPSFAQESLQYETASEVNENLKPRIYGDYQAINAGQAPLTSNVSNTNRPRSNIKRVVRPVPERIGETIADNSTDYALEEVVPTAQRPEPIYVSPEEYQRLVNAERNRILAYNNGRRAPQNRVARPAPKPSPYQEMQLYQAPIPATTASEAPVGYIEGWSHTVKKGDTLYSLARRYKVQVQDIRSANGLRDNTLSINQTLLIPSKTAGVASSETGTAFMNMGINQSYHEINPSSETRPVYAERPRTTYRQPYQAQEDYTNQLVVRDSTGQLRYAVEADVQTRRPAVYAVLPEDTLYGISRQSCIPVNDIIAHNRLNNPNALKPGQRLNLPAGHCLPR